jgi:hypothetical protein
MLRRLVALLASTALLPACVNHVRYSSDAFETSVREVVHADTVVEPHERVLQKPEVELDLLADETAVVRKLRTRVRSDEYTPYKSGYELWEIPVGTVCVPVVIVLRAADLVGLGVVSGRSLDDFSDFAFTAMNPLLNLESESRLRRREVSRETEELGRTVERELKPLPGAKLALAFDPRAPHHFSSDALGRVHTELLALVPEDLPGRPRSLRVTVEGEGKREPQMVEIPVSRALGARLAQALEVQRHALAPGASPELVGRSLAELDALGFSASALALENELRSRKDASPAWLARLDAALRP